MLFVEKYGMPKAITMTGLVSEVVPLGDPIEVTLRGYELSIRKDEAEMIEVTA